MTEFSITYNKTTFDYAYIEKLFNQGMMIDTILTEIQESREHDLFYTGRQHLLDFDRTNSMYHIQSIIDEINDKSNGCCVYSGTTTYYIVANHKVKFYMNKNQGKVYFNFNTKYSNAGFCIHELPKEEIRSFLVSLETAFIKWDAENQEIIRIYKKLEKKREINISSIHILLDNTLSNAGIDYATLDERFYTTVIVKLNKRRILRLKIRHSNFFKEIQELVPTINSIMELCDCIKQDFTIIKNKTDI